MITKQKNKSNPFELVSDTTGDTNVEKLYLIDFSKLQNVNDLVICLASVGLTISNKNPMFDKVKQFLLLEQPFEVPTQQNEDERK